MYTPRFNPNSAVSNWKARLDYLKGYPGAAMSGALNGGFFGAAPIEATGGTITTYTSGSTNYKAHTFTGSGTFAVTFSPADQVVDFLVIAGGGGVYPEDRAGGGGAGGYREFTGVTITAGAAAPVVRLQH